MINNKDSFEYNLVDYILRLQSTNVVVVDNLITDSIEIYDYKTNNWIYGNKMNNKRINRVK